MNKIKMLAVGLLLLVSRAFALEIDNTRAVLIKGEVAEYNMIDAIGKFKRFAKESTKPVYLIINSPGGSVLDGFELVNQMESLEEQGIKTICVIETMAYSMAAILATYCQETHIHKFASLMYHPASYGAKGTAGIVQSRVNFTSKYLASLNEDVAKRIKMPTDKYEALIQNEWWLTAKEALGAGLVKSILNTVSYTVEAAEPPKGFSLFFRNEGQVVHHPIRGITP